MEPLRDESALEAVAEAFTQNELLVLYVTAFVLASVSGLFLAIRDREYRDGWNLASISVVSGFIGLACVCFLVWITGGRSDNRPVLLFASIAVGLAGKRADRILPAMVDWGLQRVGIELSEETPTEESLEDALEVDEPEGQSD